MFLRISLIYIPDIFLDLHKDINSALPASGSPEAEDGLSRVWQAILRPQAAHQTSARGTQGEL